MRVLLLTALCALAIANRQQLQERYQPARDIQDESFKSGREYQFVYNGQLATGMPGSSQQHSATRIQAIVYLVFKGQGREVQFELKHIRMAKQNEYMPHPQSMKPFAAFEEEQISEKHLRTLRLPLKFEYKQGMIEDVVLSGADQPWSANIKRGVLNMLQVNLHKRDQIKSPERVRLGRQQGEKETSYRVLETVLGGRCEALYTILEERSSGGPVLNVTKSINFEECDRRPDIKYNFRFQPQRPGQEASDEETSLHANTVSKYEISGTKDEFLIEEASVKSIYTFAPFNQQKNVIATYVDQHLRLVKSGQIESRIQPLVNPQQSETDLMYSPKWDVEMEEAIMEGREQEQREEGESPFHSIPNKVQFVETILTKLANAINQNVVQEQATTEFTRLVKTLRMLNKQEISQVHTKYYKEVEQRLSVEMSKKVKDILIDAFAAAGTKDAIDHLVEQTKIGEINPVKAAMAIKSLINVRIPSKDKIEKLLELAQDEESAEQSEERQEESEEREGQSQREWRTQRQLWRSELLDQSALLTAGSLVNYLCAPNGDKLAREIKQSESHRAESFCPPQFRQKIAQNLVRKYASAQNWQEKILLLKTMSNAGLVESLPKLAKIIRNKQEKPMVRAEAILALRKVSEIVPMEVQELLLPIFKSQKHHTQVRIAAIWAIMQTEPERFVIDQVTRKLQTLQNKQVLSFTISMLHSLANSTNPRERKLAQDVQTSLRAGRGMSPRSLMNPLRSKYLKAEFNTEPVDLKVAFTKIISQYTKLPERIATKLTAEGFWSKHGITLGLAQSETDELVRRYLMRGQIHMEEEIEERQRPSSPIQFLKNIVSKLGIRNRQSSESPMPRGFLYLRLKDQEFGYLPFSQQMFQELMEYGRESLSLGSVQSMLRNTHRFELTKVLLAHEAEYKIPTSLGLPLAVQVRMPSVMHASGTIRAKVQPLGYQIPKEIELETNIKPSGVWAVEVSVHTWSPVVSSGAGIEMKARAHYPLKAKLELNLENPRQPVLEAKWEPAQSSIQALTLSSRPYTSTKVWPQPMTSWPEKERRTVMGEEKNRAVQYTREYGRQALGVNIKVHGFQHSLMPVFFDHVGLKSAPGYLLSGPNKLQVIIEPGHQMPTEFVLKASGHLLKESQQQLSSSSPRKFKQTFSNSFFRQEEQEEEQEAQEWEQEPNEKYYQSQIQVELYTKGSSTQRKVKLQSKIQISQDLRVYKEETKLERTPIPQYESQPWKMCTETELVYPRAPRNFRDLADRAAFAESKTTWGQQCNGNQEITIRVKARRSEQQKRQDSRHVSYWETEEEQENEYEKSRRSPVARHEHLYRASDLLQYDIDVQYNNVPKVVRNATIKAFQAFKMYNNRYTETNKLIENLPEKEIQMTISLDERSRQEVNITVQSPLGRAIMRDIPLRYPIVKMPNLGRRANIQSLQDMYQQPSEYGLRPKCQVSERRISTFDQVEYRVPVPNCWTVLAKDCRQQENPTFAVLIKNKGQGQEQKVLKIVSRFNTVVLEPESQEYNSVLVKVNQQSFKQPQQIQEVINHGHVVLRVEKEGEYVMVQLPESGVQVYFDGYTAKIRASPMLVNEVCGLCGNMDYDEESEFVNPQNEEVEDVREFVRQYILEDSQGQCLPSNELEICKSSRCENDQYSEYNYDQEEEQEWEERESQRSPRQPRQVTKVLERNGEMCFSKEPVPRCARNTYPIKRQQPTKVVFACMDRNSPQAERWAEQVERERAVLEEVSELEETFFRNIAFPEECEQYEQQYEQYE